MDENLRKVVVGASVGALVGAAIMFLYGRLVAPAPAEATDGVVAERSGMDGGRLFRLAVGLVAVVRQLAEL